MVVSLDKNDHYCNCYILDCGQLWSNCHSYILPSSLLLKAGKGTIMYLKTSQASSGKAKF